MAIYFTSDLHLGHNKDFIWKPRGFNSVQEMNETIIKNWNEIITSEDTVYVLGDLTLGDLGQGRQLINQLKGKIYVVLGNHDTDARIQMYETDVRNIQAVTFGARIKAGKKSLYLSHYPTVVANGADEAFKVWNLHGHTHSKQKFCNINACYNVALDAHDNKPVNLEEIKEDIKKYEEEIRVRRK